MMINFCGGSSSSNSNSSHHKQYYYSHLITRLSCLLMLLFVLFGHVTAGRDIGKVIKLATKKEEDTFMEDPIANSRADEDMSSIFSREEMVQMAGYGEDKLSTVFITGTVVWSSDQPKPIIMGGTQTQKVDHLSRPVSGAIVAATCRSDDGTPEPGEAAHAHRVKAVTDKYGEFSIDLPSHLHAIPDIDKACSIEIHSVPGDNYPRQSLSAATIIGISKGLQLSFSGDGIRAYSAGTIEFMPKQVIAD